MDSTFVFINDVHINADDKDNLAAVDRIVKGIDRLSSEKWPAGTDCADEPIRLNALIINGDLCSRGQSGGNPEPWKNTKIGKHLIEFIKRFPNALPDDLAMFIGLGNHDLDPPPPRGMEQDYYRDEMWDFIREWYSGGGSWYSGDEGVQKAYAFDSALSISSNENWKQHSLNWFDVDGIIGDASTVLYIGGNRFLGDTRDGHADGLAFASSVLASLGNGARVILCQHYGWDSFSSEDRFWTEAERNCLLDTLAKNRVIGIFHGHIHTKGGQPIYHYTTSYKGVTYNCFTPGDVLAGYFGICRVRDTKMDVAFGRVTDDVGTISFAAAESVSILLPSPKQTIIVEELLVAQQSGARGPVIWLRDEQDRVWSCFQPVLGQGWSPWTGPNWANSPKVSGMASALLRDSGCSEFWGITEDSLTALWQIGPGLDWSGAPDYAWVAPWNPTAGITGPSFTRILAVSSNNGIGLWGISDGQLWATFRTFAQLFDPNMGPNGPENGPPGTTGTLPMSAWSGPDWSRAGEVTRITGSMTLNGCIQIWTLDKGGSLKSLTQENASSDWFNGPEVLGLWVLDWQNPPAKFIEIAAAASFQFGYFWGVTEEGKVWQTTKDLDGDGSWSPWTLEPQCTDLTVKKISAVTNYREGMELVWVVATIENDIYIIDYSSGSRIKCLPPTDA